MTETAKTWQKRVARWKAIKDSPLYQHMDAAQQKQFVQLLGDLGFSLDKHGDPPGAAVLFAEVVAAHGLTSEAQLLFVTAGS